MKEKRISKDYLKITQCPLKNQINNLFSCFIHMETLIFYFLYYLSFIFITLHCYKIIFIRFIIFNINNDILN